MSGFNLGNPANTNSSTNTTTSQFGFGSSLGTSFPTATTQISNSFGNTVNPTLTFGATPSKNASISFGGASVPSQPLSFGATVTTLASSTTKPSFSLGSNSMTANAPLNLSLGSSTTTSSFSLGTSNITSVVAPTISTQFTLGISATTTTSSAPVSKGLGGIDTVTNISQAKSKDISALEMSIPNEISQLVNNLKDFLKQQKTMSTELARMSSKGSSEVADDIMTCQKNLQFIEHNLDKQKSFVEKLRFETNKCLQDFEIAQRNHDHPAMVQNDMESNIKYFSELIKSLQEKGNILKNEIENTQQYLATLPYNNNVTIDELRRIGEMYYKNVIALAGHLHGIHNEVQVLKARHLSFRREILNDYSNIFQTNENNTSSYSFLSQPETTGPNPFSGLSITASAALNLGTFGIDQSSTR
ncbi:nucleoporin p58/p45 [Daktulosphaira vitifoliae]|uniref:nucleoporin p58/p45 n=1 Tax=Daktulosphaira vitifoliae TaxID=58002 RepID=UPI0021A9C51F|nr:nucleoporin p58/p45 [Daktulosphaira vitifoliae]